MNLFYLKIKNGFPEWSNKEALSNYFSSQEGKELTATFSKAKSQRTLSQNAYLWGIVYKLVGEATGHSVNEVHEILKRMFIPPRIIVYRGKELRIAGSTSNLSKIEFSEYLERIRAEAGELGITIPDPEQAKGILPSYPEESNEVNF